MPSVSSGRLRLGLRFMWLAAWLRGCATLLTGYRQSLDLDRTTLNGCRRSLAHDFLQSTVFVLDERRMVCPRHRFAVNMNAPEGTPPNTIVPSVPSTFGSSP